MKAHVHVVYARPDPGCRKAVTLNGGPFNDYTVGLRELNALQGLLSNVQDHCGALPVPPAGKPHRLYYELITIDEPRKEAEEVAAPFELPTLAVMAAFVDAEMERMGIAQPGAAA